ncbi:MAG: hypothetical protein ABIH63_02370 [archaeon]
MEKEHRKAKGYEAVAIELEYFLKKYTPLHWREPLSSVMAVDMVTIDSARQFVKSYDKGKLPQTLEEHPKTFYHNPNVAQAVKEFFEKGLHKKYLKKK